MANFLKSLRFGSYVGLTSYCFCNFVDELALISFVLYSIDVFLFFPGNRNRVCYTGFSGM